MVVASASAEELADALQEHPAKAAAVVAMLTKRLGPGLARAAEQRVEDAVRAAEADPVGTLGRLASTFLDGGDR